MPIGESLSEEFVIECAKAEAKNRMGEVMESHIQDLIDYWRSNKLKVQTKLIGEIRQMYRDACEKEENERSTQIGKIEEEVIKAAQTGSIEISLAESDQESNKKDGLAVRLKKFLLHPDRAHLRAVFNKS